MKNPIHIPTINRILELLLLRRKFYKDAILTYHAVETPKYSLSVYIERLNEVESEIEEIKIRFLN